MVTKYDDLCFSQNIPFLTRMMQTWTKNITTKWRWRKNSKYNEKDTINGFVYVDKISKLKKLSMAYNIR